MVNELEAVKRKIAELETKKTELERQVSEITQAIENSIEDLLIGRVSEEDVENVKELLSEKQKELAETTELLQRAYAIKRKLAVEKFVPFAKERRKKKIEAIQERYDEQVQNVISARKKFLKELSELGRIKNEVSSVNGEFDATMYDLGEKPSIYGLNINERKIHSPMDYTKEELCIGLKVETQEQVYSNGKVPDWVGDE